MSVANPTDVVKIRLQADSRRGAGVAPRYTGSLNAYSTIIKESGIKGLWTGVGPNILRNSVICATELAAYDQTKQVVLHNKLMKEGIPLHILSGLSAGFAATVVGSPVDVLKTRIMNAKPGQYKNMFDCVLKTFKEGPLTFYNGFWPNFVRLGSFNIAVFVFYEQMLRLIKTYIPPKN
eukprot:Platyproteum_vivax@DN6115_c0_g1_i2.p1